jgi:S-adenosylmethionine:tRNA ribosyltransferase-isomerase
MRTADFDYDLPPELIAQTPAQRRDGSRLLVLHRDTGEIEHRGFADLPAYLQAGDILALNDSRVIPARLRGENPKTGGRFELLLLEETSVNHWWAMMRPGKRARVGTEIVILDNAGRRSPVSAVVIATNDEGHRQLRFSGPENIVARLDDLGETPLPPYIVRNEARELPEDRERYQTVFAQPPGSVAAPTAGLHFTTELLDRIRGQGVEVCLLTLHVGLGTFGPVKAETLSGHVMHEERFNISADTARRLSDATRQARRVVAVGTTTVRLIETLAHHGGIRPGSGTTRIFIHPPFEFKAVGALLTNFHLPRSTLLMLVSAFAAPGRTEGRDLVLSAYAEAVRQRYRFYSYGDAMLIV